ncbi:uncharacterized protein LOC122067253 [Macadamia integrifolia]|uniref:uncharacterized protein LOC122067253 n=1 Tax=Macadamia integrifolia TaxID=60698 RepID=UPI001C4FBD46|nr:uncharacterized protein LOC122067253 [Macadamia integrifolia]
MDCCLVVPVAIWRRISSGSGSGSRLGYRPLSEEGFGNSGRPVTVIVGKEKREFLVDPFVLEEDPFRILLETMRTESKERCFETQEEKGVIFVDVDAILFEHMLWLMYNDCSSLFNLNLREILDFYAQDA